MSLIERAAAHLRAESAEPKPVAAAVVSVAGAAGDPARGADLRLPAHGESITLEPVSMRRRGLLSPGSSQRELGTQFQVVKRPLLAGSQIGNEGNPRYRIMLTSALAGEGKTFNAINLAISLSAEKGRSVLLIDCDVIRPAIPRYLGYKPGYGLMNWLRGERDRERELIRPTSIPNLGIIDSGPRANDATELLSSQSMRELLGTLEADSPDRLLVFDSPPVLLATEARALAGQMGRVVLVVQGGRTPRRAVADAVSALGDCAPSLLLNKVSRSHSQHYSAYGYA